MDMINRGDEAGVLLLLALVGFGLFCWFITLFTGRA